MNGADRFPGDPAGGATEDGATDRLDEADQALLAELADLYTAVDPVPDGLIDRIGLTLTLADLEIELARLTGELTEPVGARGSERIRTVTFASESMTVMITISPAGGMFRLDGWLAPGAPLRLELRSAQGSSEGYADAGGRFDFTGVASGLVQLVVHPTPGAPVDLRSAVVTPAVEL